MIDTTPVVLPDEDSPLFQPGERASSGDDDHYEIVVKGYLEAHRSESLGGLRITHDAHGNTHLVGCIPDQAALHGILAQIRDLGLVLIALRPQECAAGPAGPPARSDNPA